MAEEFAVERVIDLPPSIVWDALVDPVLVEGWLHPSERLIDGTVLACVEGELLHVRGDRLGEVRITLGELVGGTRVTSTLVCVELTEPPTAAWSARLDQLEALLRGHPVDWSAR